MKRYILILTTLGALLCAGNALAHGFGAPFSPCAGDVAPHEHPAVVVNPASISIIASDGSSGAYTDLDAVDGNEVQVEETTGADALRFTVTYEDVTTFNNVLWYGRYEGHTAHQVVLEIYNNDDTAYDVIDTFVNDTDSHYHSIAVYNPAPYIDGTGDVILQLRHVGNGSESDYLNVDQIVIRQTSDSSGGGVTHHASLLGLDEGYDHPQYVRNDTYERHYQINAGAASLGPTAPSYVTYNSVMRCIEFDNDNETAFVTFEVPDDWVGGEDMLLEVDWIPNDDAMADGETVKWDFRYRTIAQNEDSDGTLTSATATHTDSAAATVQGMMIHTAITLDYDDTDNPLTKQDHVYIEVSRDMAGDTFTGGACVSAWELLYNSNDLPQI